MLSDNENGAAPNAGYANLKDLYDLGIMQEANRLFFHPLGLAMTWLVGDNGEVTCVGIQDAREDPEGCVFSDLTENDSHDKAINVAKLREKFRPARERLFGGSDVQPIGDRRSVEAMSKVTGSLDVDSIVSLVSLGLKLGTALVERHAQAPISTLTDSQVQSAIAAISIRHPDDLIAEGERAVKGDKAKTISRPVKSTPDLDRPDPDVPQTGFDTGQDFDENVMDGEDEGSEDGTAERRQER